MAGKFSLPSRVVKGEWVKKGLENKLRFALYIDHWGRSLRGSLCNKKCRLRGR